MEGTPWSRKQGHHTPAVLCPGDLLGRTEIRRGARGGGAVPWLQTQPREPRGEETRGTSRPLAATALCPSVHRTAQPDGPRASSSGGTGHSAASLTALPAERRQVGPCGR